MRRHARYGFVAIRLVSTEAVDLVTVHGKRAAAIGLAVNPKHLLDAIKHISLDASKSMPCDYVM